MGGRRGANQEIAHRCQVDPDTVRRWRARFVEQGVQGVGKIAKGRGRKSPLNEGTVAEIVRVTCHEKPGDGGTHWTTRLLAKRFGLGKDTIAKVWADHNFKPWKISAFKMANDPHFEDKLVAVVGLYMNPPKRAVVISFDEKTQCQAMDRTQPSLPMVPGRAGTMTHDYKRHGTTDLCGNERCHRPNTGAWPFRAFCSRSENGRHASSVLSNASSQCRARLENPQV